MWLECSNIQHSIDSSNQNKDSKTDTQYHQKQIRLIVLNCNRCDEPLQKTHDGNTSNRSESENQQVSANATKSKEQEDQNKNSNIIFKHSRDIGTIGTGCNATLRISVFQIFDHSDCLPQNAIGTPIATLTHHLPSVHNHELNPNNRYSSQLPEIVKQKGREYFELPIGPRDWRTLMKHYCRFKLKHEMQMLHGWSPSNEA